MNSFRITCRSAYHVGVVNECKSLRVLFKAILNINMSVMTPEECEYAITEYQKTVE